MKVPVLTVAALMLLAAPPARADEPVKSTSADLDGDGKPEAISVQWGQGDAQFVLKVGGATVRGKTNDAEVRGVSVIDLDGGDKWKEVAVDMGLTDDDHRSIVYGFDGKALKELGSPHALTEVRGNGIVLSDSWMGFWNRREKYALDRKAWKLNPVPQELYFVGAEATVKKSFPIVRGTKDKAVVANLAEGSKIQVLAAAPVGPKDPDYWYLVKSSTGLLGWTRGQNLQDNTEGLPWAG
ncbi:hypothetical protein ATI61_101826 [Archangium gephyra]|uniref:SH3 domain-containing protein n=1 Tax=Archangium gephyra TaxID=48 RepID=A0AAC8QB36_9BACT|nr:hypothetical protein [Archangium gephyra]AKJ04079.1 Hypothetical protein AA314_05705 [Archangium gephyra]REG37839.1 hypothetical protein ATI61_101826 [Archangium gephyra]